MLDGLYKSIVIEHAKYRRNHKRLEGENVRKIHYKNPTCGDVITLYLQLQGEKIKEVTFEGVGCSISMASSSMMTELIKNKDLRDVTKLRGEFERLIRNGSQTNEEIDLGDAISLQGVNRFRARHNCALMAWQALDKLLADVRGYKGC
ncbi:Fe-S cluster assembly sulfur transfer protein SufU [Evansella sp. AB-rgal1]|uniref:Fe-S cluster assembly sulfur transfer protein SufU n=1 Tax=Evansella sp. AB-rgal1 TaxID=3242696 RepID=UPI00359F10C6